MSKKFGALFPSYSESFKVELVDEHKKPIIDNSGKRAFIEVYHADGKMGRSFDKERRRSELKRARSGDFEPADSFEANIEKCAALTKAWHLVGQDGNPVDVPCTRENAQELFSIENTLWFFVQPWGAANDAANFTQRPSSGLSDTEKPSGETAES